MNNSILNFTIDGNINPWIANMETQNLWWLWLGFMFGLFITFFTIGMLEMDIEELEQWRSQYETSKRKTEER